MTGSVARSEFILGGQKSGKSRRAELLARDGRYAQMWRLQQAGQGGDGATTH